MVLALSRLLAATLPLTVLLGSVPHFSPSAIAQTYRPPTNIGLPSRREGGGTRSDCPATQHSLTALVPDNGLGYTLQPYPTWYWYVPDLGAESAEFVLYDSTDTPIYQSTLSLAAQPGVIHFSLPSDANLPPLQVEQRYRWELSVICNPNNPSSLVFVDGWIERTIPSDTLMAQLAQARPLNQAKLYAEAGLWFDALHLLGQLRQNQASLQQPIYTAAWRQLLGSVDLTAIANEPLSPCCRPLIDEPGVDPLTTTPAPSAPRTSSF